MDTKVCSKCGVEKELGLFSKQASNKDGYRGVCKECMYGHPPLKRYRKVDDLSDKECTKCHQTLPIDNFMFVDKEQKYRSSYCNTCRNRDIDAKRGYSFYRVRNLKKLYSLTEKMFEDMLLAQHNKCKICGEEFTFSGKITAYVDHDHSTGKVRGLLCAHCNSGLGFFNDNTDNLKAAIKYLEDYQES